MTDPGKQQYPPKRGHLGMCTPVCRAAVGQGLPTREPPSAGQSHLGLGGGAALTALRAQCWFPSPPPRGSPGQERQPGGAAGAHPVLGDGHGPHRGQAGRGRWGSRGLVPGWGAGRGVPGAGCWGTRRGGAAGGGALGGVTGCPHPRPHSPR